MIWIHEGDPDHLHSFTLFCPTATDFQNYLFTANSAEEKTEFITILENTLQDLLNHKPSYGSMLFIFIFNFICLSLL